MAYTVDQLSTFFKNANAGTAPTAAQTLTLQALANQNAAGTLTNDQAFASTVDLASDSTTAVSVGTYEFFLGYAPNQAGLAALNAAYVGTGSQAGLNGENRFIAQSVSLALQNTTAKASFAASYGSLSVADATKAAYNIIIGNAAATAAGVNIDNAVAYLTSATSIAYYTAFVKANVPALATASAADVDLAVKAAIIGEILYVATSYNNGAGLGSYATASTNLIKDLADDGALTHNNTAGGIDLFANYGPGGVGSTTALTTGIDTVVGTSGNDTITALQNATTGALLTALDSIDGGAGVDTLTVTDAITATGATFAFPATATITNVEVLNVTTTGELTDFDASVYTSLTTVNATSADAGAADHKVTVGDSVALSVTAASGNVETVGGETVSVTNAGAGTTTINGDALASATVTGGGAVTISDNGEATLTSVTLKSVNANTGITSDSITSVTVGGTTSATRTVTITNAEDHVLTVNAQGTNNAGGTAQATIIADATATSFAVNASAKASVNLTGAAATSVTSTGAGALTLDLTNVAAATSFNGTAATGAITLTGNGTGLKTIQTGAGADTFTIATGAANKAVVSSGAGNDVVTVGAFALAAGSTISLGAGDDKLLGTVEAAVSTSTAVTSIDGGAGTDTLAAALVNNGNGGQFTNFEILGLNSVAGLDLALLTNNQGITGLELVAGGRGTYSNVTAAQSLSVTGTAAAATTLTFTGVSGTADAYSISFNGVGGSTLGGAVAVNAGTVSIGGIEAVTVNSGSASGFTTNTIVLTDSAARTLTITGSQAANVSFATAFGTAGTNGLSLIDASSATGAVTLNTTNAGIATGGLTVNTGSGADVVTLASAATVNLGAGADSLTLAAAGGTVTTGAGADTVNVAATVAGAGLTFLTTITDATAGDKIVFAAGASATETFTTTKVDATGFQTLQDALNAASAADGSAAGTTTITWFQYGGNTYIVEDLSASTTAFTATDIAVKLTGLVDLSTATYSAATNTLTLA